MSRTIITPRDVAERGGPRARAGEAPAGQADNYLDRVVKYVPADVIAVYLAVDNILKNAGDVDNLETYLWVVFAVLLILTPIYLWRVAQVRKRLQIAISTASFAVWVFALGGPFTYLGWYEPIQGAILLPLFTFGVSIFQPDE